MSTEKNILDSAPLGAGGSTNVLALLRKVTTFIFDVDGVLTNGNILIMPNGLMARQMNVKDGYALQLAVKKNYHVVVISGGNSAEIKERMQLLGVQDVYMRITDKKMCLEEYMLVNQLQREEVLFMGDDIPDYEVMQHAGVACSPADAAQEILSISHYISPLKGGEGCARDVIEKVMKLRGDWRVDTHIKSQ
jgi:3-deoxy-D-manno-octulosonate 8-phosphate phosphatase (KDO 8-P phosphatase)